MATISALHRAPTEVQRLRAQIAVSREQLAELARLVSAHLAADPGPVVSLSSARQWSAEAYARGRADGIEAGRLAVMAELKDADRAIYGVFRAGAPIWSLHINALRRRRPGGGRYRRSG